MDWCLLDRYLSKLSTEDLQQLNREFGLDNSSNRRRLVRQLILLPHQKKYNLSGGGRTGITEFPEQVIYGSAPEIMESPRVYERVTVQEGAPMIPPDPEAGRVPKFPPIIASMPPMGISSALGLASPGLLRAPGAQRRKAIMSVEPSPVLEDITQRIETLLSFLSVLYQNNPEKFNPEHFQDIYSSLSIVPSQIRAANASLGDPRANNQLEGVNSQLRNYMPFQSNQMWSPDFRNFVKFNLRGEPDPDGILFAKLLQNIGTNIGQFQNSFFRN